MNKKQRDKNRMNAEELKRKFAPKSICPNCGQPGPHFVPPVFGAMGFYICKSKAETTNTESV